MRAPLAAQPDGTTVIDTFRDRISANVVQVGDALLLVDTVYSANRAAVCRVLLSDSANAVLDEGPIGDPGFDSYQGAIAAHAFGDVVVAFMPHRLARHVDATIAPQRVVRAARPASV